MSSPRHSRRSPSRAASRRKVTSSLLAALAPSRLTLDRLLPRIPSPRLPAAHFAEVAPRAREPSALAAPSSVATDAAPSPTSRVTTSSTAAVSRLGREAPPSRRARRDSSSTTSTRTVRPLAFSSRTWLRATRSRQMRRTSVRVAPPSLRDTGARAPSPPTPSRMCEPRLRAADPRRAAGARTDAALALPAQLPDATRRWWGRTSLRPYPSRHARSPSPSR